MKRNVYLLCFLALTLGLLGGCSSQPAADQSKKAAPAPDKIQGRLQLLAAENSTDAALNAGGTSAFIWVGARRFRLFMRTRPELVHDQEYVVEGVWAQRVIDEIGDPANGANGYPLEDSARKVVTTAWKGQAFDVVDTQTSLVSNVIKRHPGRPLFLVTKIQPAPPEEGDAAKKKAERPTKLDEVKVPAAKQKSLMLESPPVQTAPLWQAAGGKETCRVYIDPEGKISELLSARPLCEATDWSKFKFKPTISGGHAVSVDTEVEVQFEPRK